MPKSDMVLQAAQRAVFLTGGVVVDDSVPQVWRLSDTDGGDCARKGVDAYTELPSKGSTFFCHSSLVLASPVQSYVNSVAAHEWGHELANRSDHVGGEPETPPKENCTSHAVMSNNTVCHDDAYKLADFEYMYSRGNVTNGVFGPD